VLSPEIITFASFLSKSSQSQNRAYGWGISCKKGSWNELEGGSAAAHVKKPSNEPSITITINAIGKTVKFPVEQGDTVISKSMSSPSRMFLLELRFTFQMSVAIYCSRIFPSSRRAQRRL
jgi:hypothetical protein